MGAEQIILIVVIVLLVIAYPLLVGSRNKKEKQKMQEQADSLKRGDKVLTTSGVYGTIVDLEMTDEKKIVTIETGSGKNKGYISVDAYAIYNVFKEEPVKSEQKQTSQAAGVKTAKPSTNDTAKKVEVQKTEPNKVAAKPAETAQEKTAENKVAEKQVQPNTDAENKNNK